MIRSRPVFALAGGTPRRLGWLVVALGLLGANGGALLSQEPAAQFQSQIKPVLEAKCFQCHGPDEQNAGVDFSRIDDQRSILRSRKLWRKARAQVEAGTMPPAEEEPLTADERSRLLGWLGQTIAGVDCSEPANRDPGPALIRRLSLAEYNHTIRDLLGFEFSAADAVGMPDDVGAGNTFGNLSAALTMPPAQVDKYFAAADLVLDRLLGVELSSTVDGNIVERARIARETLFGVKSRSWQDPAAQIEPPADVAPREAARQLIARFARRAYRRPVSAGEIDLLLKLYDRGEQKSEQYVKRVRLMLKAVLVSPQFLFRIEADRAPAGSTDVYRVDDHELAARLSYFLWSSMPDEQLSELADQGLLSAPGAPGLAVKLSGLPIGVPNNAHPWAGSDKAFDGDLWSVYESSVEQGSWIGLDLGVPRVIRRVRYAARPHDPRRMLGGKFQGSNTADFSSGVVDLHIVSQPPESERWASGEVAQPDAFRYVRYLVPKDGWGNVAEVEFWGQTEGTVLEQQVRRMLADAKARALADNFAAGWLQLRGVTSARPSTEFFPEFTPDIRRAMFDETALFVDTLRAQDRSLLELLDADYTYLNEDLAKFYKIPGVAGKEMRRVSLTPDMHRGGLLGMGSILALTSHTSRTSPSLRGKWILEVLFGTPPPPPPANVSMLKEQPEKGAEPQAFRQKMAQHSANPACAACHTKMDPLGYALENYNAVGVWRDNDGGRPPDTAAELPTGEKLNGAGELKDLLRKRQDQFFGNLSEQMLIYALGRELDYFDDCPVREISTRLVQEQHRYSALVLGIVNSYPFQYRRNTETRP